MSSHCAICFDTGHRERDCDTPRFNDVSQRCQKHGAFRCGACLYHWALDTDRDDLADALRVEIGGARGGQVVSVTELAVSQRAWREYEAEQTQRTNAARTKP